MKKNFLGALIDNPNILPSNQNTLGHMTMRSPRGGRSPPRTRNKTANVSPAIDQSGEEGGRYGFRRQSARRFDKKGAREVFEQIYLSQHSSKKQRPRLV